jgi:hypothetical protein
MRSARRRCSPCHAEVIIGQRLDEPFTVNQIDRLVARRAGRFVVEPKCRSHATRRPHPTARDTARQLEAIMPQGVPPILLFRTFAYNLAMSKAKGGGYELSKNLSLSMRDREIVIDRVCARCNCEYEWGVHIAFFAERVDLWERAL